MSGSTIKKPVILAHQNKPGLSDITLSNNDKNKVSVTINKACRDLWLPNAAPCDEGGVAHVILAVTDNGKT